TQPSVSTMSYNNCCSRSYSSHSIGNSCHSPATSSSALCSTEVSCRDAPCSPCSSLGSNIIQDNCQESCSKSLSYQPTRSEGSQCSPPSGCSPVTSDTVRSHQGTSCLPVTSGSSSACRPESCSQPLSCRPRSYQSFGCQPLNYVTYGRQPLNYMTCDRQPLSYLTCDRQPLSYLTYGRQPLRYLTYDRQPLSYLTYDCQPASYLTYGRQPLNYMSDCYRPINYTFSDFQPYSESVEFSRHTAPSTGKPPHTFTPPSSMHTGSMSFLGSPGICGDTSYRTYCYIPVTSSAAVCSNDVSPTLGPYLPSSYQGNLWLLDNCQESYAEVPSCESPSCELKTCHTTCGPSNLHVPCDPPTVGKVSSACETNNVGPGPSCSPRTRNKGYVSDHSPSSRYVSKACQTPSYGSDCFGKLNYLSKSFQPLSHCRVGSLGYRNYLNLGVICSSTSPSCSITYNCQPPSYSLRNCKYGSIYKSMGCQPLNYFSRSFRSLNSIPSTFPPL
ncbi:Keratin-associated protein 24-1, partial [Galemys pyrenaicus]